MLSIIFRRVLRRSLPITPRQPSRRAAPVTPRRLHTPAAYVCRRRHFPLARRHRIFDDFIYIIRAYIYLFLHEAAIDAAAISPARRLHLFLCRHKIQQFLQSCLRRDYSQAFTI